MACRTAVAFLCTRVLIPLLFASLNLSGQQKQGSTSQTVDWKALTPKIQQALGREFADCFAERRWIDVVQTADITGDGIPEALVEYCHMGAYTSAAGLIRMENGNAVLASFRDQSKKPAVMSLLRGASVRNGADAKLLPAEHAMYLID